MQPEPYLLPYPGTGTVHETPYDYDTHVPWLLRRPGHGPRTIAERVATVDVAPTLAALIGLDGGSGFDGVDRGGALP